MKMFSKNKALLISGVLAMLVGACSSGSDSSNFPPSPYSVESYVTMAINPSVCASAQFFSSSSMYYLSNGLESAICVPYITNNETVNNNPVESSVVQGVVDYYYGPGAQFESTCPTLGPNVAVESFPSGSRYALDVNQIIGAAKSCAAGNMTIVNNTVISPSKPMFVFDVDDTLLSDYAVHCQNKFGTFNPADYASAGAYNAFPNVPNMDQLLNYAFKNNIYVAFVSARDQSAATETESNLIAGYPQFTSQIQAIFNNNLDYFVQPSESTWTPDVFKNTARQALINQGYTIVLNIGDQYSDLNYQFMYSNQPSCSYKLPNYMYYIP